VSDAGFMQRALDLAEQAAGLTSPNPTVGAVLVRGGVVVGEGFHAGAGRPHAEREALAAAGNCARDATLYVSLEPCVHQGRTPPCAPAVIAAGLARVVVATLDPNPVVNGRGVARLREAGLAVEVGLLGDEARALNRGFFTWITEGRPHVTLKAAMTLDGKIADVHGGSRWITGGEARAEAHRLRSRSDAIVVGIGTALADDPELSVRLGMPWPREPYRVVVDAEARLPADARLLRSGTPSRAVIAVGSRAAAERVAALRAAGATVVECPDPSGRVDLRHLLDWLAGRAVTAVLLEGGGGLNAAFLEAGLVDRVVVFVAPLVMGGRAAPTPVEGDGLALKDALRLRAWTVRWAGEDVVLEGDLEREQAAAALPPGRRAR
jgi:diaminohydroxyphosphoribosylaminopyrimidine deaminase/5-amino-6-(5-phosphoribosylamino)uracil reductase